MPLFEMKDFSAISFDLNSLGLIIELVDVEGPTLMGLMRFSVGKSSLFVSLVTLLLHFLCTLRVTEMKMSLLPFQLSLA